MPGTISPWVKPQYFTNSGEPAAGYQLFTYSAGTTNKIATYTDVDLLVPNTNPIILDSAGRCLIFLAPGVSYKFVFTTPGDTDPPSSPIWTVDNVSSVPLTTLATDVVAIAGEALTANEAVYLANGSEGGTSAGRWYKTDADFAFSSSRAGTVGFVVADIASGAVGTVRVSGKATTFSSLTAGALYYLSTTSGGITTTEPAIGTPWRLIGQADSITSIIMAEKAKAQTRERVAAWSATVGNITTGEDTLNEYIAPVGELGADLMTYTVTAWGKTANNANAKTLRLRLIENANNTVLVAFALTVSELGEWRILATIMRSAAAAGRVMVSTSVGPTNGPVSREAVTVTIPTVTWANTCTIRLTGDATSTNDITCEGMHILRRD